MAAETGERPLLRGLRTVGGALGDIRANLRRLAATDLLYKVIAVAVLLPAIGLVFRLLIARGEGGNGLSDAEIASFLFTTVPGVIALVFLTALVIAVFALEMACLMTLGLAHARGTPLRVRDAFAHAFSRTFPVYRLAGLLVLRLLLIAAPFVAALGVTYWALLTAHDINYYLGDRPPQFWAAVVIGVVIVALLVVVLSRRVADWLLALPIVVFEGVLPIKAFGASVERMHGHRLAAAHAIIAWGAISLGVSWFVEASLRGSGRLIAPAFSGSMAALLLFIASYAIVWLFVSFAVGVLTAALLSQIVVRHYATAGLTDAMKLPAPFANALELEGKRLKVSWKLLLGGLALSVVLLAIFARWMMQTTWTDRPVLVIAHRGSSVTRPENTLASFQLAIEQKADFVELDVQESGDGVVLVNHDVDLMRDGNSPLKIWNTPAAQLQAIDIGRLFAPEFLHERVPSLAQVFALCKGKIKVDVELKDYGHDVMLEERVGAVVDSMGMADQIISMSLSQKMAVKMKQVRPTWDVGLLAAKIVGAPGGLPGDFLAVEKGNATRAFVRKAHAAGKPVYAWTVNDPQTMIRLIGFGVDGIITDNPALGRQVVDGYMAMSRPEKLYIFVMTRLGAREDMVQDPEKEERP